MKGLVCLLVMPDFKPGDPPPRGYLEWHEWARVQERARLKQRPCGRCGLWRYPQELSGQTVSVPAPSRRGRARRALAPVCTTCAPADQAAPA